MVVVDRAGGGAQFPGEVVQGCCEVFRAAVVEPSEELERWGVLTPVGVDPEESGGVPQRTVGGPLDQQNGGVPACGLDLG